jgi:flagellar protein FliS
MYRNANEAYLEGRVLSASPVELVCLLYQAATDAVREARRHLEAGNIEERSRCISKACEVLVELNASLDVKSGGEIGERLRLLYEYMLKRLFDANLQQEDAPLAETLGLLATLSEAWEGVAQSARPPAPPRNPFAQAPLPDQAYSPSAHAWNF